jgi:HD-GYP domain-containing protein (c-di-GMP phosphodiesterase class II)
VPGLESVSLVVLHHHERMDGRGYPAGLEGDQIPLGARIVCVVDAFDAMLSSRSYRNGLGIDEAIRRLRDSSPDQFDPKIVAPFIELAVSDHLEIAKLEESAA